MNTNWQYGKRLLGVFTLLAFASGCATNRPAPAPEVRVSEVTRTAPGVVEYIWEEPMVDVVEVPPGLDPEGIYYRPAHQEVVEIRQGRWKYYKEKQ